MLRALSERLPSPAAPATSRPGPARSAPAPRTPARPEPPLGPGRPSAASEGAAPAVRCPRAPSPAAAPSPRPYRAAGARGSAGTEAPGECRCPLRARREEERGAEPRWPRAERTTLLAEGAGLAPPGQSAPRRARHRPISVSAGGARPRGAEAALR